MELPIQILLLIVPSLIIFLVTYLMNKNYVDLMQKFFQEENKRRREEIKNSNQATLVPLRLQAYERMLLFLERTSPSNLVMRIHQSGMTAHMLHAEVIKTIRNEYEHNLSQQIYLSIGAWELVKTAKEETAKLINMTAERMSATATGLDFGQSLIEISTKLKKLPTEVAIEYLKKEFAETF